jgi:threonine/homoserine/homoserine lactone efflux protein
MPRKAKTWHPAVLYFLQQGAICPHSPSTQEAPQMTLFMYLMVGIIIVGISSGLASFVNKKTNNGLLTAIAWFGSAYLLFELILFLTKHQP